MKKHIMILLVACQLYGGAVFCMNEKKQKGSNPIIQEFFELTKEKRASLEKKIVDILGKSSFDIILSDESKAGKLERSLLAGAIAEIFYTLLKNLPVDERISIVESNFEKDIKGCREISKKELGIEDNELLSEIFDDMISNIKKSLFEEYDGILKDPYEFLKKSYSCLMNLFVKHVKKMEKE